MKGWSGKVVGGAWHGLALNPLDHVLVGGGVRARSVGSEEIDGTAHRALVAELAVPAPRD